MRKSRGSGRWCRSNPKFGVVSKLGFRNVFSITIFFFFVIPSFSSSRNISLFISHLRYYHVWALTTFGPSSRARCCSLGLEWSETEATHIVWERDNLGLDVCSFASLAERLTLVSSFKYPSALCYPLLSRITVLHASKYERRGSREINEDSSNTYMHWLCHVGAFVLNRKDCCY